MARHRACADSMNLKAIATLAVLGPRPLMNTLSGRVCGTHGLARQLSPRMAGPIVQRAGLRLFPSNVVIFDLFIIGTDRGLKVAGANDGPIGVAGRVRDGDEPGLFILGSAAWRGDDTLMRV